MNTILARRTSVDPNGRFVTAAIFTNFDDFQVATLPGLSNHLGLNKVILSRQIIQVRHDLKYVLNHSTLVPELFIIQEPRNSHGKWSD